MAELLLADCVELFSTMRRFFPSQAWQDFYYAGLRDGFHYHRDIIANASKIVHAIHTQCATHPRLVPLLCALWIQAPHMQFLVG